MAHGDGLDELSAALTARGIAHVLYHDCIHISLHDQDGHVEIKSWVGHNCSVSLTVGGLWTDLGEIEEDVGTSSDTIVPRLIQQMANCGVEPASTAKE